jgi:hypothetical protein
MEHDKDAAEPMAAPAATAQAPDSSRPDMVGWARRRIRARREKIAAEIERNRRGEAAIPTWVLVALLVVILGAWATLVVLS